MIYRMVEIQNPIIVRGDVIYKVQSKRQDPEEVIICPRESSFNPESLISGEVGLGSLYEVSLGVVNQNQFYVEEIILDYTKREELIEARKCNLTLNRQTQWILSKLYAGVNSDSLFMRIVFQNGAPGFEWPKYDLYKSELYIPISHTLKVFSVGDAAEYNSEVKHKIERLNFRYYNSSRGVGRNENYPGRLDTAVFQAENVILNPERVQVSEQYCSIGR